MDVLDLLSSWQSHLPEKLNLRRLAGLEVKKWPIECWGYYS